MSREEAEKFMVVVCGPSQGTCKCNCPDSCDHKWDGPIVPIGGGESVTCSLCGIDAFTHSMWVDP